MWFEQETRIVADNGQDLADCVWQHSKSHRDYESILLCHLFHLVWQSSNIDNTTVAIEEP